MLIMYYYRSVGWFTLPFSCLWGGWPFALFIGLLAVIAFIELIAMKKIERLSLPSIVGAVTISFLLVIKGWAFLAYLVTPNRTFYGISPGVTNIHGLLFQKTKSISIKLTYIVFSVLYVGYG